ncbi:MAG: hypothetical protein ABW278_06210 [Steroidobacteraceae bacterium]
MSDETARPRARIWKALGVAVLLAVVTLVTIVLPAEYGIDPTRIGKLLGLTAMSGKQAAAEPSIDDVIADVIGGNDTLVATTSATPQDPLPLPNPAVSQLESAQPRTQTMTIRLGLDEKTEVKAVLRKSKVILYHWEVEGGNAYVDFHGHDPAKGDHYWVRYEEAGQEEGINGRSGSLVAPFDGEHGWFWLNTSQQPITIHLTVSGYFDRLVDYGLLQ